MRLDQLRVICTIVDAGFSVSRAAESLNTPQPGVSRQLRALERELGVDIFARNQKRLLGLTRPGVEILRIARNMLEQAVNLGKIGREFSAEGSGDLIVATTHTQSRYALPSVIKKFTAVYPGVRLMLRQGTPTEVVELVRSGEADLCIGSDSPAEGAELVLFPCNVLERVILAPAGHPLLKLRRITMESLASYPIITYDAPFIGRSKLLHAFSEKGLTPNIVLSAIDTDVIKVYVEMGIGVAIVASLAYDPARDKKLRAIDASHLFAPNTIYLGVRRNDHLRGYVYGFIEMYASRLDRATVNKALSGAKGGA
jgi:LysR family transcriptional regulator, cys regulon transcriptional activator